MGKRMVPAGEWTRLADPQQRWEPLPKPVLAEFFWDSARSPNPRNWAGYLWLPTVIASFRRIGVVFVVPVRLSPAEPGHPVQAPQAPCPSCHQGIRGSGP